MQLHDELKIIKYLYLVLSPDMTTKHFQRQKCQRGLLSKAMMTLPPPQAIQPVMSMPVRRFEFEI
jgi:hypothetical protein